DFDPATATFKAVTFDDVRAVGWYIAKTDNSTVQTHNKWYGFRCDAVINAPEEGSSNIEMVEVKNAGTPNFNIATCEVPYTLWQDIYRWGDSPSYILEARYIYDKSGSMGSMAYGKRDHQHDEPLTDITFYDALALCNTLSEMEGKTPCYYTDPEFKTIFRNQHIATRADYGDKHAYNARNFQSPTYHTVPAPKIYVKWAATGHRLPTVAERS
ncbi:MAG: SUMF1/EgtB/PvdO family nonheme iron enzyme, partial [Propionibacteriaceae bacterium]|nr:SUMF1/EgtB/PvdO family nonheme iron enzyme [Propionibacteriaceae bacterium]